MARFLSYVQGESLKGGGASVALENFWPLLSALDENIQGLNGMTFSHACDLYIGQKMKGLRVFRKLTQMKLAPLIGVTYQQIQKYERGASRFRVSVVFELADALGVSPLVLLPDIGQKALLDVEPSILERLLIRLPDGLRPTVYHVVADWEKAEPTPKA